MRNKIRVDKSEERRKSQDLGLRRFVFSLCILPTVLNLLIFTLLVKETRGFVFIIALVSLVYYFFGIFVEIKVGDLSIFAMVCNATASALTTLFFILAYSLYYWFIAVAVEIAIIIILIIKRNNFIYLFEKTI